MTERLAIALAAATGVQLVLVFGYSDSLLVTVFAATAAFAAFACGLQSANVRGD